MLSQVQQSYGSQCELLNYCLDTEPDCFASICIFVHNDIMQLENLTVKLEKRYGTILAFDA